jgi:hypothetical protein
MEFVQADKQHRCWLANAHAGYHCVNEWGILYWAHPLQGFGQATESFMSQLTKGEPIRYRSPEQTEEDMRKFPHLEMDYSVPMLSVKTDIEVRLANITEQLTRLARDVMDLQNPGRWA